MSHSVLRRYTPPTCTLEIIGKSSPLSRWTGQPAIKDVRFRLKLDDPRLSDEQKIEIEGDRAQLEALREAVETYVQDFLAQSPNRLNATLLAPTEFSHPQPQNSEQETSHNAKFSQQNPPSESIFIQPKGLLSHELFLGAIATKGSGNAIQLSSLQLFDLATALDEYATDVVALPTLNPDNDRLTLVESSRQRRSPQFSDSFRVAASILLALGLTTYSVQKLGEFYLMQPSTLETSSKETSSPASQQIAIAPSPVIPSRQTAAEELTPTIANSANSSSLQNRELPDPPASLPESRIAKPRIELPSPESAPSLPSASIQPTPKTERHPLKILPEAVDSDANPAIIPPPPPEIQAFPEIPLSPPPELEAIAPPAPSLNNDSLEQLSDLPEESLGDRRSAFNPIPQLAEAGEYFQQRWNPPDNLPKTIEYSLVLNPDGTIQQIIPLGDTAKTFLDRTPIPLLGEPFVSPLENEFQPTIRLVLHPDGAVQTFLQTNRPVNNPPSSVN